jgi:hypothetical protein
MSISLFEEVVSHDPARYFLWNLIDLLKLLIK